MRFYVVLIFALCASFFAHSGMAASGFGKGQVEFVRTHDSAQNPGWEPPRFWFSLKGVTAAGNCAKWATGTVLFVANDKQTLAVILSAQASGQEIAVSWDDAVLAHGHWCVARYVTVGNPAPAF